jgi:hypothetical protein
MLVKAGDSLMFLITLFVLVPSYALGMNEWPNNLQSQELRTLYAFDEYTDDESTSLLDNEDNSVRLALEKIKKTPATKFDLLEANLSLEIIQRALNPLLEEIDVKNVHEKIANHKTKSSDNYFKHKHYHRCDCASPNHLLKSSNPQYISYVKNEEGVTIVETQQTPFRAELLVNDIYVIQRDTNGSPLFVGPHVATLEDSLTKNENVTITIANDASSEKIIGVTIIGVIIEGYNLKDELVSREKLTGKTAYVRPKRVFHYVATPKEPTEKDLLLDNIGETIQIINREALSTNNFSASEILENQIKSYAEVQQLIAKRSKKQRNCSVQ